MADSVSRIPTDNPAVYAIEISGEVSSDAMEALAKQINAAFDAHEENINMLMIFRDFKGSESDSMLDSEVISSRFKALSNVEKYAVVGAPDGANIMVKVFGSIKPVQAHTFELSELDQAWDMSGASPSAVEA